MIDMKKTSVARGIMMILAIVACSTAMAQENRALLNVEAGVRQSDNITRATGTLLDPTIDETIFTGGLTFDVIKDKSNWDVNARGSLVRYQYQDGIFDDETLSSLNGDATWKIVPQIFEWFIRANHGQQILNPFEPVTPVNREDVTILETGPRLSLPVGRRNSITADVSYTDISYELRPFDNQRLGGGLGFQREISPTRSLSFNVSGDRIEFDNEIINPPIERYNAYLGFGVDNTRNNFSVNLGWNTIERAGTEGDGLLLEFDWGRELTPQSRMTLNLGSKFSTNGDIFRLNDQIDNQPRDTQDVQDNNDAFRYDYAHLGYALNLSRTTANLSVSFSEEKYETNTNLDRRLTGFRVAVLHQVSRAFSLHASGSYDERKYPNVLRNDEDTIYRLGVILHIGAKTNIDLSANRIERSSSNAAAVYDETQVSLIFTYRAFGEG